MKEMIDYILQFGTLNKQQIEVLINNAGELSIAKDRYFSEAGKIPKQVGFVIEGVIRGFYYDENGKEITRCFIDENSLVCDYINFEAQTFSSEYLQAVTNCKLIVFSSDAWENLSQIISGWDSIKNKMVHLCMHQKSRKGPVISHAASYRYIEFLNNYPMLINRVPLSYIASYLGVTQQSLSRIRKNIY